jgi:hypothetical protein
MEIIYAIAESDGGAAIPLLPNAAFLTIDLHATRTENTRARAGGRMAISRNFSHY